MKQVEDALKSKGGIKMPKKTSLTPNQMIGYANDFRRAKSMGLVGEEEMEGHFGKIIDDVAFSEAGLNRGKRRRFRSVFRGNVFERASNVLRREARYDKVPRYVRRYGVGETLKDIDTLIAQYENMKRISRVNRDDIIVQSLEKSGGVSGGEENFSIMLGRRLNVLKKIRKSLTDPEGIIYAHENALKEARKQGYDKSRYSVLEDSKELSRIAEAAKKVSERGKAAKKKGS
jgi:hypothetical protein